MARPISPTSRTPTGVNSIPIDDAAPWTAPNWPTPEVSRGSRRTAARNTRGAISLSSSTHFVLMPNSNWLKPVALPPRQACDEATADGIEKVNEHDWQCVRCVQQRPDGRTARSQEDLRLEGHQLRRVFADVGGIACAPAQIEVHVSAHGPTQSL